VTHPGVEEVALHLEGVLDPADEQRVRAHLERCDECAATARDLVGVSEQLHAAARLSDPPEPVPPIPGDVAARVEYALTREADDRAVEAVPAAAALAAGGEASDAAGDDLDARRRRRRRVLSGGLLAAAAATVVAVGLGEVMQGGGSAQVAGSAGSAPAERPQTRPDTLRSGPEASALTDDGLGVEGLGRDDAASGQRELAFAARLRDMALIEGVAAAHSPDRARHDLPACVRGALGGDLGPVASYAVRLPRSGGIPGVVVLRPSRRPTEGVLVACTAPPQVLARRGLQP